MSSKNLRDLHPYAKWDDELPPVEIDTHPAEPFDDPDFMLDDGLDEDLAVEIDTHERETAEIIVLSSRQLRSRRFYEWNVDTSEW